METQTKYDDYINKMYDSNLQSQKTQLETDYQQNVSNLDAEKTAAQKQADAALTRTYVEAAKDQKAYTETQNAYGLTSGAMAQARLAQDNQLQADLTAIRAVQQETDAEVERQRSLLAKEYSAAIRKAQAENDMEKAQALYAAAQQADADLLTKQKEAASLVAGAGDFSLYQALYGLTDDQVSALRKAHAASTADGGEVYKREETDETDVDDDPVGDTYETILQKYIAAKKAGANGVELIKALRYYVDNGIITERQATDIRDYRY